MGRAGGAPCGDLVRLSLEVRDGSVARVSFDAEGCGAAAAAAAAAAELADDAEVLDAARIDADAIATSSVGSGPRAGTPRIWPPTRCTARSPPRPAR